MDKKGYVECSKVVHEYAARSEQKLLALGVIRGVASLTDEDLIATGYRERFDIILMTLGAAGLELNLTPDEITLGLEAPLAKGETVVGVAWEMATALTTAVNDPTNALEAYIAAWGCIKTLMSLCMLDFEEYMQTFSFLRGLKSE
ncbi:hypothetical protein BXK49_23925 [Salmonella enterica subsp. enterica serovar Enteritidis]|nr:hypothetical protein [Salmonella enterica subsp. enterica serovar Enteritidis]ECQ9027243.1 hypothetical protein [Salmonella enterica subsp. enterica serovar Enteritidis]EDD7891427.1 hypothetical protein [Salmonella enterica subsp. enterica serovar Enteritidis]